MDKRYKPGNGWKHLAGPVWEHSNGVRIHLLGLARLPSGGFVSAVEDLAESLEFNKYLRINGGNRKRGLMAWANSLMNDSDMRDIEMSALETGFMDEGGC